MRYAQASQQEPCLAHQRSAQWRLLANWSRINEASTLVRLAISPTQATRKLLLRYAQWSSKMVEPTYKPDVAWSRTLIQLLNTRKASTRPKLCCVRSMRQNS